jgi:hypothetical protein
MPLTRQARGWPDTMTPSPVAHRQSPMPLPPGYGLAISRLTFEGKTYLSSAPERGLNRSLPRTSPRMALPQLMRPRSGLEYCSLFAAFVRPGLPKPAHLLLV